MNAGLLDVVMLGAGSAIGSSIFSVLGPAARLAGPALPWAIMIAIVPMAILAMVYAFVASVLPRSGASYEWPREFIGARFAFAIAWLRILGSVGMLIVGSLVLAGYLAALTQLPPLPLMIGLLTAVYACNLFGVAFAARAQTLMMILLLAAFATLLAAAWPAFDPAQLRPLLAPPAIWPLLAALPLLVNLFMGIEAATEIGEEVRDARRLVPRGIALAVILTAAVYATVAGTALALIGVEGVAASPAPLDTAAAAAPGGIARPVMTAAAILCLAKSLNVNFMIFARNLYAMARSGVLPAALARVHPRFGTPHVATTAVFLASCLGLLLPRNLVYLLIATTVPTLLKYVSTCLCALVLRRRRLSGGETSFLVRARTMDALAIAGALCAGAIALIGIGTDWRPYVLIGAWGALGVAYWRLVRPPGAVATGPTGDDDDDVR